MKIAFSALNHIEKNVSKYHHETGGILGAKNSRQIITEVFLDINEVSTHPCSYVPSVDLLNNQIAKWDSENIKFKGLFHTHFAGVKTLSEGDKSYIKKIMKAMPEDIRYLYFPIFVIPENVMVPYYAYIKDNKVIIQKNRLEII